MTSVHVRKKCPPTFWFSCPLAPGTHTPLTWLERLEQLDRGQEGAPNAWPAWSKRPLPKWNGLCGQRFRSPGTAQLSMALPCLPGGGTCWDRVLPLATEASRQMEGMQGGQHPKRIGGPLTPSLVPRRLHPARHGRPATPTARSPVCPPRHPVSGACTAFLRRSPGAGLPAPPLRVSTRGRVVTAVNPSSLGGPFEGSGCPSPGHCTLSESFEYAVSSGVPQRRQRPSPHERCQPAGTVSRALDTGAHGPSACSGLSPK